MKALKANTDTQQYKTTELMSVGDKTKPQILVT